MSILSERFAMLCKEKGVTPYRVAKETGIGQTTFSRIKLGQIKSLNGDTAAKIANYFGVSVDYLLGLDDNAMPKDPDSELARYLEDLRERPETRALLAATRHMTPEQVKKMAAFAKTIRGDKD